MPAVSGSSGRLIVSGPKVADTARDYPGRVFEREELSYREAMDGFIATRRAVQDQEPPTAEVGVEEKRELRAVRRGLRGEEQRLREGRAQERERRRLVDGAWEGRQREYKEALAGLGEPKEKEGRERGLRRGALRAQHRAEWAERRRELARRREEDARWRQEREKLRERERAAGIVHVMAWIAILVIVDNCTRRCLGLPLFAMGAHVTAELVVAALAALLPKGLEYLISDGGSHFTADVLKELATARGFVRVPLAKHRAQSNGIAERFIETLKGWLAEKEWQTPPELGALLGGFLAHYNDRPHQGRELAGLSPNEYTARLAASILGRDIGAVVPPGAPVGSGRDACRGSPLLPEGEQPCRVAA